MERAGNVEDATVSNVVDGDNVTVGDSVFVVVSTPLSVVLVERLSVEPVVVPVRELVSDGMFPLEDVSCCCMDGNTWKSRRITRKKGWADTEDTMVIWLRKNDRRSTNEQFKR